MLKQKKPYEIADERAIKKINNRLSEFQNFDTYEDFCVYDCLGKSINITPAKVCTYTYYDELQDGDILEILFLNGKIEKHKIYIEKTEVPYCDMGNTRLYPDKAAYFIVTYNGHNTKIFVRNTELQARRLGEPHIKR